MNDCPVWPLHCDTPLKKREGSGKHGIHNAYVYVPLSFIHPFEPSRVIMCRTCHPFHHLLYPSSMALLHVQTPPHRIPFQVGVQTVRA